MNTIVRSRFPKKQLEEKIHEILSPYTTNKLNCWWILAPNSSNHKETEALLQLHGFQLEHEAFGLLLPSEHRPRFKISPRVTTEKIRPETLRDYLLAARDGAEPAAGYISYFQWLMSRHGNQLEVFLSRVDGEPAGTGLLQHLGGAANLVSGFVRPKFRGLGAYQALVAARLESLREQKIPYAVVLSKAQTSAPILMRNGFQKVCEFRTLEKIALGLDHAH